MIRFGRPAPWLGLVAIAIFAIAAQGCALLNRDEHSRIVVGPDGMRTFTFVTEMSGVQVACPAFGLVDPVRGRLAGVPGEREPVWLEHEDGTHLSVVWPAGFSVRFEPGAILYSEKGVGVAAAGEEVELSQTSWGDAAGTFEDPYIAQGLVFNGCYPYRE